MLIALRVPPGERFLAALERAWERGDALLPLAADLPEPALARVLDALRPAVLVDEARSRRLPDPVPVAADVALVVSTSGSTGPPKGVELTHATLHASARASLDRLGARPGQRWLCCLPLHHIAGLQVLLRARLLGTPAVIHPRFDVDAVAAAPAEYVSLVPRMLSRLLDAGVDLTRFRAVLLGGAAPPPGLLTRACAAGATVVQTYGMTETCGGCVYDGVPLDGVEIGLDEGRIRVRGPVVMAGYRCDQERSAAVLRRDGWLHTADLGEWTPDGRLVVLGRADDVIVTGGENVPAADVAGLLRAHPLVAEAAVVGRPDPDWGERVVAVCVPADPANPPQLHDLRAFVRELRPAAYAPRELHLVDALPRSALGKITLDGLPPTRAHNGDG